MRACTTYVLFVWFLQVKEHLKNVFCSIQTQTFHQNHEFRSLEAVNLNQQLWMRALNTLVIYFCSVSDIRADGSDVNVWHLNPKEQAVLWSHTRPAHMKSFAPTYSQISAIDSINTKRKGTDGRQLGQITRSIREMQVISDDKHCLLHEIFFPFKNWCRMNWKKNSSYITKTNLTKALS